MSNELEKARDEALNKVQLGETWLQTHPVTHPQYAQAQALLEQRRAELHDAQCILDTVAAVKERGWAWDDRRHDAPPSMVCAVCGEPVFAAGKNVVVYEVDGSQVSVDTALPGNRIHFGCLGR